MVDDNTLAIAKEAREWIRNGGVSEIQAALRECKELTDQRNREYWRHTHGQNHRV